MIKLIFAVLLLLLSLLVLFRAPTNFTWLVAVAVTNYPWVPMLLAGFSFYLGDRSLRFHWPVLIISGLAFIIFSLPVIAAFRETATVPSAMRKVFPVQDEDRLPGVYNFFRMFGGNKHVAYTEFVYKRSPGRDLLADFYPAAGDKPAPLVIVIHGGSWESGDNKQLPELNSWLAAAGYNVAAITYRLAPQFEAPAPVEDVHDAIDFLIGGAAGLHIDTNNIFLLGRSAGGQIALSAAYGLHLPSIRGVINYYGPADMVWGGRVKVNSLVLNTDKIYRDYFGGLYKDVPGKFLESSAIDHAESSSPPTLMIHGEIDPLVSIHHEEHLQKRLDSLGVKNYFLRLPFATHGCDYSLKGPAGQVSRYAVLRFFKFANQEVMEKLAIIGTGIAGMGAADMLRHKFDITVFEKNDYIGGHTNTVSVNEGGREIFIDTGFMVFNYETYPYLSNLFRQIGAPVKQSDMSFSVQHVKSGLEYCGSGLGGLFAQRKNIFSARYIRMLLQITRFNRDAVKLLDDPHYADYSLKRFIDEFAYGDEMLHKYLVPMSAAVWSMPPAQMLDFPAMTLIRFFKNHGFLGLNTQHQWYTLHNGSRSYREILIKPFRDRVRLSSAVTRVERRDTGVRVSCADGYSGVFHKAVLACHGDQALQMLAAPTIDEERLLRNFKYQKNLATVHTDSSVMPANKKVWSSWNYRIDDVNGEPFPTTIYWMNRLQNVSDKENYFVSINAVPLSISPKKILKEIAYEHPLFDVAAIKAQAELHLLNERGPLYFCGSYFKYGFHEDAYASAVKLSEKILNG